MLDPITEPKTSLQGNRGPEGEDETTEIITSESKSRRSREETSGSSVHCADCFNLSKGTWAEKRMEMDLAGLVIKAPGE